MLGIKARKGEGTQEELRRILYIGMEYYLGAGMMGGRELRSQEEAVHC